jgi:DNA-damage-inducible protein D
MEQTNLIPFEGKPIRKIWNKEEWWFSVVDAIEILTDSSQPSRYWSDLKKRTQKETNQSFAFCERLKLPRPDGKNYPSDCANTEGLLRIIMAVPSHKAEPLRLWLAQVGQERIEEAENPELAFDRAREIYKAKGYPDDWIGYREKSILIRKELTDEWKKRDVSENIEYAILTAEIAKATFGLTPYEHKNLKGLERQNLRDHMTNFELILTALSEEATRHIAVRDDAQGFNENHDAAVKGGNIGGKARRNLEKDLGESVVSNKNFLNLKDKETDELPPKKGD